MTGALTASNTTITSNQAAAQYMIELLPLVIGLILFTFTVSVLSQTLGPGNRSSPSSNKNRDDKEDEQRKPGIKVLGIRVKW